MYKALSYGLFPCKEVPLENNPNGLLFGTMGLGKSFVAKCEMVLVRNLKGQAIKLYLSLSYTPTLLSMPTNANLK